MLKEKDVIGFLNGRDFAVLLGVLLLIASVVAALLGNVQVPVGGNGVFFPAFHQLIPNPLLSWAVNLAAIGGVCVLLLLLQKMHTFIRSYTSIFVSAFLILQIASPMLCVRLFGGTLMCLLVISMVSLMFACYQDKDSQRSVFAIFASISACAMFQYSFLFLLPVFFVGFVQMRAMNLRSALAAILGIITPYWIVAPTMMFFGAMPLNWSAINAPQLQNLWSINPADLQLHSIILWVATLALAIVLSALNMLHLINYNLQTRSCNGFFVVLTFATAAMMCIDFRNISFYLPILNMCIAIQIAHSFTINKSEKRYIPILILIALALTSYSLNF